MAKDFDHAAWERWCEEWNNANFDDYPDFQGWHNASTLMEQGQVLSKVLNQAEAANDVRMARAVYRHAIFGSVLAERALRFTLEHAQKTEDSLLARDVYQHSSAADRIQAALDAYQKITGSPLTN